MVSQIVTITNQSGLHARPANTFVKCATRAKSDIIVRHNGQEYNGKSILAVLNACIRTGAQIELVAVGEDEDEALKALIEAVDLGLGE